MALLQISEPGLSAAPHQRRLAAGIDLGTTNSLVATVRSGQAETLADHEGRHLLPSVVHYQQQGHSVGYDARTNAALDTANTISSVKRLMGRSLADIQQRYPHLPYQFQASENGLPMIETAAGLLNPVRVSADILKALAARAPEALAGELDGVDPWVLAQQLLDITPHEVIDPLIGLILAPLDERDPHLGCLLCKLYLGVEPIHLQQVGIAPHRCRCSENTHMAVSGKLPEALHCRADDTEDTPSGVAAPGEIDLL